MWWPSVFNISSYLSWLSFSYLYQRLDTVNTSIKVITYEKGDIVQNFELETRLELLGLPTFYIKDDNWKFAIQSDSGSALQQFEESSLVVSSDNSFVVLLDDSKIQFQEGCVKNGSFCVHENIFHGGHGEIWRAYRLQEEPSRTSGTGDKSHSSGVNRSVSYILKRMRVKDRPEILQCALREILFGELLVKTNQESQLMFARYVTSFVSPGQEDYWLVFMDEGMSLQQTMYATVYSNSNALLMPSQVWRRMRTTPSGEVTLKGILYQLLSAVDRLHSLNITHRDLKPSNILLNVEDKLHPRLLVADFSSALHASLMDRLYAVQQPSIAEETLMYAPPEVLLSINTTCTTRGIAVCPARGEPFYSDLPTSYDMWSIGVVYLELLLGTADVFSLDDRSVNIITQKLRRKGLKDADSLSHAVLLAGLSEYCIFNPEGEAEGRGGGGGGDRVLSNDLPSSPSISGSGASLEDKQLSHLSSDSSTPTTSANPNGAAGPKASDLLFALDYVTATSRKRQQQQHTVSSSSSSSSSSRSDSSTVSSVSTSAPHSFFAGNAACLSKAILRRDPLGKGFTGLWGLDLLSRLLRFDPLERITAEEALQHAYFVGPYVSDLDDSEHGTQTDLDNYNLVLLENLTESEEELEAEEAVDELQLTDSEERSSLSGGEHHPIYLEDELKSSREEQQQPDKKIANNQHAIVSEILSSTDFVCPSCGRVFKGDYAACLRHATSRGHGLHCLYSSHSFPPCLSEHPLQPVDPQSGWCDLQGTRQYIEDVHAMYFDDYFHFFGVFDGHFGPNAAKFASKHIYGLFHQFVHSSIGFEGGSEGLTPNSLEGDVLQYGEKDIRLSAWLQGADRMTDKQLVERQGGLLGAIPFNSLCEWRGIIQTVGGSEEALDGLTTGQLMVFMADSFLLTHNQLIYRHDQGMELSGGATATAVVLLGDYLLVAHVGDSRVIACCAVTRENNQILPVQLTLDHTPHSSSERQRVEARGGWVERSGSVPRVNGLLAVTRSLGDPALRAVLSAAPDVLMFRYRGPTGEPVRDLLSASNQTSSSSSNYCSAYRLDVESFYPPAASTGLLFVVVGSDGLWDVMTNLEASEFVCEYLLDRRRERRGHALHSSKFLPIDSFHEVSKLLAYEALVRGSSDNIGVNVIDLLDDSIHY